MAMEKTLLETITEPKAIARHLADFEASRQEGAGTRTGGSEMNLGILAASGLHVKKISVYRVKDYGAFDMMAELELANLRGEKVDSDFTYLTQKPVTKDTLPSPKPGEAKKRSSQKDWP
jgi:hypothetical protein